MKKTYSEQFAEVIGLIAKECVMIAIGFLVVISRLLYRFRKFEWKLAIFVSIFYFLYAAFPYYASAPRTAYALNGYTYTDKPTSEHEQIINYIYEVFGDEAANAFKILSCENPSLNPNALGHNDNGTVDVSIFQINSIWANPAVSRDWKTNINIAYQIFKRDGWSAWTCEYKYHVLEK